MDNRFMDIHLAGTDVHYQVLEYYEDLPRY